MDSLCAESEDFEEMNLDIDNSVTAVEEKTDELVDSDVALESEGSSCLECPCPSMGSDVTPQPVVASVAVHKSLGVWFGEDGSVVQIHPGGQVAESGVQRGDLLVGMNDLLLTDAQEIRHELSRLRGGSETGASLLFCPGDAPDCVASACPGFGHRLSLDEIMARAAELAAAAEEIDVERGEKVEVEGEALEAEAAMLVEEGATAEAKSIVEAEIEETKAEEEEQDLAALEEETSGDAEAASKAESNDAAVSDAKESDDAAAAEAAGNPWSSVFNVKWVHAIGAKKGPATAEGVQVVAPSSAERMEAPALPAKPSKSTWGRWLTGAPTPSPLDEEASLEETPSGAEGLEKEGVASPAVAENELPEEKDEESVGEISGETFDTTAVPQENTEGEAPDEETVAAEDEEQEEELSLDAVAPPSAAEVTKADAEELSSAVDETDADTNEAGAEELARSEAEPGADFSEATAEETGASPEDPKEPSNAGEAAEVESAAPDATVGEAPKEAANEETPAALGHEVEMWEDSPAAEPEDLHASSEESAEGSGTESKALPESSGETADDDAAVAAATGDNEASAPQKEEAPKATTSSWGWGWFSATPDKPTESEAIADETPNEEEKAAPGEEMKEDEEKILEVEESVEGATTAEEVSLDEENLPFEEESAAEEKSNNEISNGEAANEVTAASAISVDEYDFAEETRQAAAAAIRSALEGEGFDAREIEAIVEQHLADAAAEEEATVAAEEAAAAAAAEELAWTEAATAEPDPASIVARLQAMSAQEERAQAEAAKAAAAAAEAAAFVPAQPSRHAAANLEEFEAAAPGASPTTVLVNPSIAKVANAAAASASASGAKTDEGAKESQPAAAVVGAVELKSWWGWLTTAPTPSSLAAASERVTDTKSEALESAARIDGQSGAEVAVPSGEGEPSVVAPLVLDEPTVEVEAAQEAAEAVETAEEKVEVNEAEEVDLESVKAGDGEEEDGEALHGGEMDKLVSEVGMTTESGEIQGSSASDDSTDIDALDAQVSQIAVDESSTDLPLEEVAPATEDAPNQEEEGAPNKYVPASQASTSPKEPTAEAPEAAVTAGSWWSSYFPSLTGGAPTKEVQSVQNPKAVEEEAKKAENAEEEELPAEGIHEPAAGKDESADEEVAAAADSESPAESDGVAAVDETEALSEEVEEMVATEDEAAITDSEALAEDDPVEADAATVETESADVESVTTDVADEAIPLEEAVLASEGDITYGAPVVEAEETVIPTEDEIEASTEATAAKEEASNLPEVSSLADGPTEAQDSAEDAATADDAATAAVDDDVAPAPQQEVDEAPKATASSWGWGWFSATPDKPTETEAIVEETVNEEDKKAAASELVEEAADTAGLAASDESAAALTASDTPQLDTRDREAEGKLEVLVEMAEVEMKVLTAEAGPVIVAGDDATEYGEVNAEEKDESPAVDDDVEVAPPDAEGSESVAEINADAPVLEENVPADEENDAVSADEEASVIVDAAPSTEADDVTAELIEEAPVVAADGASAGADDAASSSTETETVPEAADVAGSLEEPKPVEETTSLWSWFSSSSSSTAAPEAVGATNSLRIGALQPNAKEEAAVAREAETMTENGDEEVETAARPLSGTVHVSNEEEVLAEPVAEEEEETHVQEVESEVEAKDIDIVDKEIIEAATTQGNEFAADATTNAESEQAVVVAAESQEPIDASSTLNSSISLVVDVAAVDHSSWSDDTATLVSMPGFGESDGRFEAIVAEAFVEVDRYINEVALAQLYPPPLPPGPLDPALCGEHDLPCAISASEIGADVLASFRPHARLHSAITSRSQLRQTLAAHRAAALRASLEWGVGSLLVMALAVGWWVLKWRPKFVTPGAQRGISNESSDELNRTSAAPEPPQTVPVKLTMKPQVHFQDEGQPQDDASATKSSVVRTLDKEGFHNASSPPFSSTSPKGGALSPVLLSSIEERGKWQSMREASMAFANASASNSSTSPSLMTMTEQDKSYHDSASSLSSPAASAATGTAGVTPGASQSDKNNNDDDTAFAMRALRDQLADTPDRYAALERAHAALRSNPDALSAFADLASSPTGDEDEEEVGVEATIDDEEAAAAATARMGGRVHAVTPSRSSVSVAETSAPLFMLEYCDPVRKADKAMVLEAVRRNGLELRFASPKLQDDREVVLAACAQNGGALVAASKQLRADKQVVLVATRRWPDAIRFASEDLKADKEVVLTAASQDGRVLQFASPSLRDDRALVLQCCGQDGRALEFASPRLQADTMVCLAAMRERPPCLRFASPSLRSNAVFMLSAARRAGRAALTCAEGRLRTDRDFFFACLTSDGNALEVAPYELCDDDEAVLLAVKHSKGSALQHASRRLRSNAVFVTKCVEVDGRALAHAAPSLRLQPALIAAAARSTPSHWGSSHVHEERHALSSLQSPSAPALQEFNILSPPPAGQAAGGQASSTVKGRSVLRSVSPRKGLASPVMSPRGPGDVGSPGSPHPVRRVHYVSDRQGVAATTPHGPSRAAASSANARSPKASSATSRNSSETPIVSASGFGWKTTQTPSGSFVRVWAPMND